MKFESDAQNLEGFHFSEFCQSLIIVWIENQQNLS
jgi:hypothetical protein